MNIFKELLGESITDDTATQMLTILDTKINESLAESQDQILELEAQVETLKEQAEKYGEHVAATIQEEMQAKLDVLTTQLTESQQEKLDMIAEHAEYIVELKEQANLYGESIAESTKEELKDIVESTIQEYKDLHESKFKALDEDSRIRSVFSNLKGLIESSGFTLEEDTEHTQLKAELVSEQEKVEKLKEAVDALEREKAITEMSIDLPTIEQERFKKIAENIRSTSFAEFKQVLAVLAETAPKKVANIDESKLDLSTPVLEEEVVELTNTKKSRLL